VNKSTFRFVFGVVNKSTFRFVFGVVGIMLQSYKKSSAEQKKLVSFFCRDAGLELVSLAF
jgi:hypothetical protein